MFSGKVNFSALFNFMALEILRDIWSIWQFHFGLELSTLSITEPFKYKIDLITFLLRIIINLVLSVSRDNLLQAN